VLLEQDQDQVLEHDHFMIPEEDQVRIPEASIIPKMNHMHQDEIYPVYQPLKPGNCLFSRST